MSAHVATELPEKSVGRVFWKRLSSQQDFWKIFSGSCFFTQHLVFIAFGILRIRHGIS